MAFKGRHGIAAFGLALHQGLGKGKGYHGHTVLVQRADLSSRARGGLEGVTECIVKMHRGNNKMIPW
jgi:hypothetical protein